MHTQMKEHALGKDVSTVMSNPQSQPVIRKSDARCSASDHSSQELLSLNCQRFDRGCKFFLGNNSWDLWYGTWAKLLRLFSTLNFLL